MIHTPQYTLQMALAQNTSLLVLVGMAALGFLYGALVNRVIGLRWRDILFGLASSLVFQGSLSFVRYVATGNASLTWLSLTAVLLEIDFYILGIALAFTVLGRTRRKQREALDRQVRDAALALEEAVNRSHALLRGQDSARESGDAEERKDP